MKSKICFNKKVGVLVLLLVIISSAAFFFGILPFYKTSTQSRASFSGVNDDLRTCVGDESCANKACKCGVTNEGIKLMCWPKLRTGSLITTSGLTCQKPLLNIKKHEPGTKGAVCVRDKDCNKGLICKYNFFDYITSLGTNASCASK